MRRHAWRPRRAHERAQSMVEMAMVAPVLFTLSFGVWSGATFLANRQVAAQAVRAGARVGAEIGNNGYAPGIKALCQTVAKDPCVVDGQMLASVRTIAHGLIDTGAVQEVDIYEPCSGTHVCVGDTGLCAPGVTGPTGAYTSGDLVDVYKPDSTGALILQGTAQYTLDLRVQTHPTETVVGVRIVYTFTSPAPFVTFNVQTSESSVMCLAPKEAV